MLLTMSSELNLAFEAFGTYFAHVDLGRLVSQLQVYVKLRLSGKRFVAL